MDDRIPHDSRAAGFIVATAIFTAVALAFFTLRIYVRAVVTRRLAWDDAVLTFGMVSLIVFFAMIPTQTAYGGGKHLHDLGPGDNVAKWGQAFVIAEIMYLFCIWAAKISICILLLRLRLYSWYARAIHLITIVVTVLTLFFVFWIIFQCSPIEAQWDPALAARARCVPKADYVTSVYVLSAISAATDLATAVIPALVIFGLTDIHIGTKKRIGASLTLAIGSMACIATFIRFQYIRDFAVTVDVLYQVVPLCIVSFAEASLGIICASMITYRPLFRTEEDEDSHTYRMSRDANHADSREHASGSGVPDSELTTLAELTKRDSNTIPDLVSGPASTR